jgi:hypothetical protein
LQSSCSGTTLPRIVPKRSVSGTKLATFVPQGAAACSQAIRATSILPIFAPQRRSVDRHLPTMALQTSSSCRLFPVFLMQGGSADLPIPTIALQRSSPVLPRPIFVPQRSSGELSAPDLRLADVAGEAPAPGFRRAEVVSQVVAHHFGFFPLLDEEKSGLRPVAGAVFGHGAVAQPVLLDRREPAHDGLGLRHRLDPGRKTPCSSDELGTLMACRVVKRPAPHPLARVRGGT